MVIAEHEKYHLEAFEKEIALKEQTYSPNKIARYKVVLVLAKECLQLREGQAPVEEKVSDTKKHLKELQKELKEKNKVLEKYRQVSAGDEVGSEEGSRYSAAAEILDKYKEAQ